MISRNGLKLQINPYVSNDRCSKQNNKKTNKRLYVRYQDTAGYKSLKKKLGPSVVTGHKENNTIPGHGVGVGKGNFRY
ncbi:hypothetical protein Bca52824_048256 [Brassica carinata]|uniref:Uncharacterized protein n=1 Tax=Brassica carinata TaxID=52824 RepID=A0A8X7RIL9_BRACI|nr:hypothetical protein Bca52824_048256 [Brassica carinata]